LYFNDEYGTPYVQHKVGDHKETMPVGKTKFKHYVMKLYYDEKNGQVLKAEWLNEAVMVLNARTIFEGISAKLHLRVAWGTTTSCNQSEHNNDNNDANNIVPLTLYYDLTTAEWSCIKVTSQKWEILKEHPADVLFTRFKQSPQAIPVREYPAGIMDSYLDLMQFKGHADRLLVKVLLVASFVPDIGHPIVVPNGEQGGVKSIVDTINVLLTLVQSRS